MICEPGKFRYDIRHSFAELITSAPTPPRLKLLLAGWQFNSLLTFYSGSLFTVYTGLDTSLTQENNDRAEIVSNPFAGVPADIKGSYAYWFNPNAFALPTLGTYSNQARKLFKRGAYLPGGFLGI